MLNSLVQKYSWLTLLCICIMTFHYGMSINQHEIYFYGSYLFLAISIYVLEKKFPHEENWNEDDGQIFPDLAHTFFTKGIVQLILILLSNYKIIEKAQSMGLSIWDSSMPLQLQVILGLIISEFGLYWSHRWSHENPLLWRAHVVHHSVERLWFLNTGRFHVFNTLFSIALSLPLMIIIGVPTKVIMYCSAITAYFGLLTHCNISMEFKFLNYLFNTPGLHRWHHSMEIHEDGFHEGHNNYGENLMVWDIVFGTFYNPKRRPPIEIGVDEYIPKTFLGQLWVPFRKAIPNKPNERNFTS